MIPRAPRGYGIVAIKAIRNGPKAMAQSASVISCLRAYMCSPLRFAIYCGRAAHSGKGTRGFDTAPA